MDPRVMTMDERTTSENGHGKKRMLLKNAERRASENGHGRKRMPLKDERTTSENGHGRKRMLLKNSERTASENGHGRKRMSSKDERTTSENGHGRKRMLLKLTKPTMDRRVMMYNRQKILVGVDCIGTDIKIMVVSEIGRGRKRLLLKTNNILIGHGIREKRQILIKEKTWKTNHCSWYLKGWLSHGQVNSKRISPSYKIITLVVIQKHLINKVHCTVES